MSSMMAKFLSEYNKTHRERFNPILFDRKEEHIINHVIKVLLSAQRDKFFTIKVTGYRVIDDYREIYGILHNLEAKRKNKRIKINKYDYIDLKDSAITLLEVNYYLEVGGEGRNITIYISIPRIVDKYYFYISGCMYSAYYQIVDGSTYNNSSSNNKKADAAVSFKSQSAKITTYLKNFKLQTIEKDSVDCKCFISEMFGKRFSTIKYFLAEFGIYGTMNFLRVNDIYISETPYEDPKFYCFDSKNGLYVSIPKMIYDANPVAQSLVYTIISNYKEEPINEMFGNWYWKIKLSNEYKTRAGNSYNNETQGMAILDSLNHSIDIATNEFLHLPNDQKDSVYSVIRWIMYEFPALIAKDNCNISTKRIRYAEYIASLYAMKLSTNINSLSNLGNKFTIEKLVQAVSINYNYLLDQLKRCKLVPYKNSVNDNDALNVLKFTYKGIAGIGEKKTSAVPNKYRLVNASHLGRVDKDNSSNTDPGMSGILCPYADVYGDSYSLSEFSEPNHWEKNIDGIMDEYRRANNIVEIFKAKNDLLGTDESENLNVAISNRELVHQILDPQVETELIDDVIAGYPLEGSGTIMLERGYYI